MVNVTDLSTRARGPTCKSLKLLIFNDTTLHYIKEDFFSFTSRTTNLNECDFMIENTAEVYNSGSNEPFSYLNNFTLIITTITMSHSEINK